MNGISESGTRQACKTGQGRCAVRFVIAACMLISVLHAALVPARAEPVPDTLIIAGSSSLAPYSFLGQDGTAQGILVDYWRLWSRKTGTPVIFALTAWKDSLDLVRNGGAHVHIGLFHSKERAGRITFSSPLMPSNTYLYALRSLGARSAADLSDVTVGVVTGEKATLHLRKQYPSLRYQEYDSNSALFLAALDGDIQAFPRDSNMLPYFMIPHDAVGLFLPLERLYREQIRAGVRLGDDALLSRVEDGLRLISREEAQGIVTSWAGAGNFEKDIDWRLWILSLTIIAGVLLLIHSLALRLVVQRRTTELKLYRDHLEEMVGIRTRDLELARDEYRTIYENAQEALLRAAPEGQLVMLNPACAQLLGYDSVEGALKGVVHFQDIFADPEEGAEVLQAVGRGDRVRNREVLLRRADGGQVWVFGSLRGVYDDEGGMLYLEGSGVDISDRKERERAELESRAAREASRAKSEFVAAISHEIRTPLNSVLGMAELLQDTELTDEQHHFVSIFQSAGENLLAIVNDVLDLSRIESGQLRLEHREFSPVAIMERVCMGQGVRAQEKGLELVCLPAVGVPDTVVGDGHRLRQVLTNLVGNAIKFTDSGEVEVRARVAVPGERVGSPGDAGAGSLVAWDGDGQPPLIFSVRDTGIGIPEDRHEAVFNRFVQGEAGTTRKFGGTGLGLSICRRLCSLMGGHIVLESVEGRGSIFTVVLPLAPPPGAAAGFDAVSRRNRVLAGLRVVCCDDSWVSREMVRVCVTWAGGDLAEASNSEELLALLGGAPPGTEVDVVLLDSRLEGDTGSLVLGRVREEGHDVPVVMMIGADENISGKCAGEDWLRAQGLAGVVAKPLLRAPLVAALHKAVGTNGDAQPEKTGVPGESGPATEPYAGLDGVRLLIVDDNEGNRDLMALYLRNTPCEVEFAENGCQAVELCANARFDVVLMDLEMPEMDGFEAVQRIREHERTTGVPKMPVVAFTAHAFAEQRFRCREGGFSGYLTKPVKRVQLLELIRLVSAQGDSFEEFVDFSPLGSDFDDDSMPVRGETKGRTGHVAEVRERFRPLMASMLKSVAKGVQEMRGFLSRGRHEDLRRRAHGLKGAALTYGLSHLAGYFDDMNRVLKESATGGGESLLQTEDRIRGLLDETSDYLENLEIRYKD